MLWWQAHGSTIHCFSTFPAGTLVCCRGVMPATIAFLFLTFVVTCSICCSCSRAPLGATICPSPATGQISLVAPNQQKGRIVSTLSRLGLHLEPVAWGNSCPVEGLTVEKTSHHQTDSVAHSWVLAHLNSSAHHFSRNSLQLCIRTRGPAVRISPTVGILPSVNKP